MRVDNRRFGTRGLASKRWAGGIALCILVMPGLMAQEGRPPVIDQNRSGAPQTARKAQPKDNTGAAADSFEKGMAALEEGRFEEAVRLLGRAAELAPADVGSRFYLAQALAQAGEPEKAIAQYSTLVELQPDLPELRLNYAQVLTKLERHAEAAGQLERAAELKPGDSGVLFQLGYAELRAGEAESARMRFAALVQKDPADADYRYGLGQAAFLAKDFDTAEENFREAAGRDRRYRNGLLAVAEAWAAVGNLERAAALFGEFPENPEATRRAGELLVELGKNEEAIASLEAVLASAPTFANRRNLATAYLRAGNQDKALALLSEAAGAEPSNADAHLALGRVLRDARKFPEAAAKFQAALRLDADNLSAWNEYAGVAMLAGEYQAAMDAIAQIEKHGSLSAGHHYLRAIILDRFRNDALALQEYELFLSMSRGQNEDEEFKARQRVRMLKNKKRR